MPRDSQGAYTLPSGTLVNTGDTLLVSQHNPAMQDLEQAITGSLDRDGKGGMRAALPMGGNKITNMADGTDASDGATVGQVSALSALPVGTVIDYAGTTAPAGFLLCYGQAVSRTSYAALFAVLGTAFGTGDGATTFNLPDCRGRARAGKDDMGGTAASRITNAVSGITGTTLGATGGAQSVTLTEAQMPAHTHSVTDPGHSHASAEVDIGANPGGGAVSATAGFTGSSTTGITIGSKGGSQAHPNVQPTIIFNTIIKATS